MKLFVVHISGLAGDPLDELDGQTLLGAAATPTLDQMARRGSCGTARLLPSGVVAGAGAELLGLLGYLDEDQTPPALGPLEAVAIQAPLYPRDVAFRVNLGSVDEEGVIRDTAGAGAPEAELLELMARVDDKLSRRRLAFYPGRAFAHVMVWTDGSDEVRCEPAPRATGRRLEEALPTGDGDGLLRQLIWDSVELLDGHRINHRRREEGRPPVNLLWPWAPGRESALRHYGLVTGQKATVVASRLEVLGAARAVGVATHRGSGTLTGTRKTMVEVAREAGLTCAHVDLPQTFEHPADPEAHLRAYEALDTDLLAPMLDEVGRSAEAARMVVVGTWREVGWSERAPALWGTYPALRPGPSVDVFSEAALGALGLALDEPGRLLREAAAG